VTGERAVKSDGWTTWVAGHNARQPGRLFLILESGVGDAIAVVA
jgi:hypothetical protein